MELKRLLLVGLFTTGLVACGGSDDSSSSNTNNNSGVLTYSGNTEPATLSAGNQSSLAKAAKEAIVSADAATKRRELTSSVSDIDLDGSSASVANHTASANSTTVTGSCGGSLTATGNDSTLNVVFNGFCDGESGSSSTINGSFSVTTSTSDDVSTFETIYNGLTVVESDGVTVAMTGSVLVETRNSGVSTLSIDVTITIEGEAVRLAESMSCGSNGECVTRTVYTADGVTYQTEDVSVIESDSGVSVTATVYDADDGYFELSATDMTYCENGNIESGSMLLSDDSDNEIKITFDGDCETMTVTMDGVAETVDQ